MLLLHISVFVKDAQNYSTLYSTSLFKNANKVGGGKHERLTVEKYTNKAPQVKHKIPFPMPQSHACSRTLT